MAMALRLFSRRALRRRGPLQSLLSTPIATSSPSSPAPAAALAAGDEASLSSFSSTNSLKSQVEELVRLYSLPCLSPVQSVRVFSTEVVVEGGAEGAKKLLSEQESGNAIKSPKSSRAKCERKEGVEDAIAAAAAPAKPRRKARATMKKLEKEIAENESTESAGLSQSSKPKVSRKRKTTKVAAPVPASGAGEPAEVNPESPNTSIEVFPNFEEATSALISNQKPSGGAQSIPPVKIEGLEVEGKSAGLDDVLSLRDVDNVDVLSMSTSDPSKSTTSDFKGETTREVLVVGEEGSAQQEPTIQDVVEGPPRTAPKFPKLDFTSKQRTAVSGGDVDVSWNGGGDERVVLPPQYSDPQKVFQMLQQAKPGSYSSMEKARMSWIFHRFCESGWVSDQALALYINSKFFPTAVSRFRKYFSCRSTPELRGLLIQMGPSNEALRFLFPIFAEFCISEFSDEINRYRELVSTADLTKPDAWYPFARAMKRKVVYHQGPTNSGKTYMALKRFMEAANGIYCSPLRLLAMEVFDKVNAEGIYCNLHTGQEKKDVPFANHLACTVEMTYLSRQWEVAIIDEVQMMSDEYRGWAWTRAFLGLQADEIHICGDPSAVPLLRSLCAATGDELVLNEYERFKPLNLDPKSLCGDFANVEAGDCIVAFSRKEIFDVKREVELATKHKCCVVYGALPPETRTQQAKLFNDPNSGYDVLVASDAVGMGLNLNIRRVVFYALDKFDGDAKRPIPASQVKQIAGRAGRRGSIFPDGVTTSFYSQDVQYLEHSLQQDFEPATAAGLFPVYEQVELFASQLPEMSFTQLLERFAETCRLDGAYFLCRYDNLKRVASVLDKVKGLSLEDRFNFCFAPVNVRDPQSLGALYRYAMAFSQKIPVVVQMGAPLNSARDEFELMDLETRHQVLSMYLWLSQHFTEELFVQKGRAAEMATHIAALLGQSLVQSAGRWHDKRRKPSSKKSGRPFAGKSSSRFRPVRLQNEHYARERIPERIPAVC